MKTAAYYKEQLESFKQMFAMTTEHLEKVRDELAATNKAMNQSVAYAEKIQNQLLPYQVKTSCTFSELYFEVWQKDTIGGDFIYLTETEEKVIFGLMDCTGHGIPGALLSMLGYNFLNEIILHDPKIAPNQLLEKLDVRFQAFFTSKNDSSAMTDGMDGILCVFDKKTKELSYSMAGRPLWMKMKNKWCKHRPDRNSIGGHKKGTFILHKLQVEKGDQLFLFSDGLPDQFGGSRNKKFLSKRIFKQLEKNDSLNLKDQCKKLNLKLSEWQGDEEQTDDISYLAIRF